MAAGSSTIALRVTARRIAIVRQDRAARGRGQVVGHLDRAKALAGTELTSATLQRLSPGEAMQARIALDRWRGEQAQEARRGQMAQAAADLDRLAALFAAEELTASELMAAVEQVRLRTIITAWEALGIALRDRARRHGLEHLFTPVPRQPLSDEDPVVIASDEAETQTLSEQDAEQLQRK
ncbi:MAG TPA: hypothetical protein VHX44_03985 [Planctomycetota bacterium]|nr:hypothetical protein [Planctomycetota bacterium]